MQDAHNGGRKGYVSLIARIIVATGMILWTVEGQDWRTLAGVFQNLSPWRFAVVLLVYTAAQVIIAVRWWLLLRAQSIRVNVLVATRLFFLGLFYNNLMPGAVGGDLVKAWYVTKHTDRRLEGVLSVFVDRTIGLIGTVVMVVFTFLVLARGPSAAVAGTTAAKAPGWLAQHPAAILGVGGAVALGLLAAAVHPRGRRRLVQVVEKGRRSGLSLLRRGREAMVVYCSKPWTLLWALVLTLIGQSVVIVGFWLLGRNLGIQAALPYYFVVFPTTWVIGAIPVSFAGLGITEKGVTGLFAWLTGASGANILALAFCQRFIWVLSSLPGGLIHLLGAHLPAQEISVDGHQRTN